jgi:hypothetical protein
LRSRPGSGARRTAFRPRPTSPASGCSWPFEFGRHGVARIQPAQVAALGGRAVLRHLARQVFEGGCLLSIVRLQSASFLRASAALMVGVTLIRMWRAWVCWTTASLAPVPGCGLSHHLEDVEADVALDDRRDLARLELAQRLRRTAAAGGPDRASRPRRPSARRARRNRWRPSWRSRRRCAAGASLRRHARGAGDLLGRGIFRDAHQDLRDVHLRTARRRRPFRRPCRCRPRRRKPGSWLSTSCSRRRCIMISLRISSRKAQRSCRPFPSGCACPARVIFWLRRCGRWRGRARRSSTRTPISLAICSWERSTIMRFEHLAAQVGRFRHLPRSAPSCGRSRILTRRPARAG